MTEHPRTAAAPPPNSVLAVMAADSIDAFHHRDDTTGSNSAFAGDDRAVAARTALAELLRVGELLVAHSFDEAAEAAAHGQRLLWCRTDALNPCWDASRGHPDRIPVRHWGGGAACPDCAFRAALVRCWGPA